MSEATHQPGLAAHAAPHHPALAHHFPDLETQKDAATLGMWVFLAQEALFFGGLFLAYTVYRHLVLRRLLRGQPPPGLEAGRHQHRGAHRQQPHHGAGGARPAATGKRGLVVLFLILTILLGSVFLGVKVVEYADKFTTTWCPGPGFHWEEPNAHPAEIFYSLYFAMTGLHALHMIIGIPIIAVIAWMAQRGRFSPDYHSPVEMSGPLLALRRHRLDLPVPAAVPDREEALMSDHGHGPHVVPLPVYLAVFAALMFGTALTVWAAHAWTSAG